MFDNSQLQEILRLLVPGGARVISVNSHMSEKSDGFYITYKVCDDDKEYTISVDRRERDVPSAS